MEITMDIREPYAEVRKIPIIKIQFKYSVYINLMKVLAVKGRIAT